MPTGTDGIEPASLESRPLLSERDRELWQALAQGPRAGCLQQCLWWSESLAGAGIKTRVIGIWRGEQLAGGGLLRSVPVPGTSACVTQCLGGPLLPDWRPGWAEGFAAQLESLGRQHGSIEVAFQDCGDPRVHHDLCAALRARRADLTFRPGPAHAVVPLDGLDIEGARRRMSEGTRRSLRKAEKNGLRIAAVTSPGDLRRAHEAWLSTARRKGFDDVRSWAYLEPVVGRCLSDGIGTVLASFKDDRLLAAVFVTFIGGQGSYVYGGFVDGAEPLAPNHALHVEAVRQCLERGLKSYDMGELPGLPGLEGLARFKLGFGAERRPRLYAIVWRRRPLLASACAWARRHPLGRSLASRLRRRLLREPIGG